MKEDILELEDLVMKNLEIDVPRWTGNLSRHITGGALGEIILSGPVYDIHDAEKKIEKYGRGNARKLMRTWYDDRSQKRKRLTTAFPLTGTFTKINYLFDYAMLLNEYGAFGGGRHRYWTNRSVVNACNLYAEQLKSKGYNAVVDNRLPL